VDIAGWLTPNCRGGQGDGCQVGQILCPAQPQLAVARNPKRQSSTPGTALECESSARGCVFQFPPRRQLLRARPNRRRVALGRPPGERPEYRFPTWTTKIAE